MAEKTEPSGSPRDALRDTLGTLSTEAASETNTDLDMMSVDQLVAAMTEDSASVLTAVAAERAHIVAAIDGIVARLEAGGRLLYLGAGTAGRMGVLDASEIPPTFGTNPSRVVGIIAGGDDAIRSAIENAEDDSEAGVARLDELGVSAADAVVGISASGRTPFVLAAIRHAGELGAFTVGFSCNAGSPLGAAADLAIETVVGPEILTGSTRLKAGTAQKLVLNMLSTITMIRLGKAYRNLMVDLRATNEKLRARSERTVMLATGADAATAAHALTAVDGWVKAAILMVAAGASAEEAVRLLAEHPHLRDAIAAATR